jgi:retinol dehydrogenase-12
MGDLAGRRFVVTGTTSGIGRTTALALAARGATLVLANRSEERTQPILAELRARHPGVDASFVRLDLGELASVRRAADAIAASGRPIDVLINNAGIAGAAGLTKDGFEVTVGTNHLGPFLFTQLLLPLVTAAPQGRVVNVASEAHLRIKGIDFEGWRTASRSTRHRLVLYGASKLMNVLHARELARRVAGTRVTTYSLHPGVVATDIWREGPKLLMALGKLFMTSEEKGARTTLHCATSPELAGETGRYYDHEKPSRANPLADDVALARELWERSERAVGYSPAAGAGAIATTTL